MMCYSLFFCSRSIHLHLLQICNIPHRISLFQQEDCNTIVGLSFQMNNKQKSKSLCGVNAKRHFRPQSGPVRRLSLGIALTLRILYPTPNTKCNVPLLFLNRFSKENIFLIFFYNIHCILYWISPLLCLPPSNIPAINMFSLGKPTLFDIF